MVTIETAGDLPRQEVANTLEKLGYPAKTAWLLFHVKQSFGLPYRPAHW